MTINLPGITFHFVENVNFVGANNKHLGCLDEKTAIKSGFSLTHHHSAHLGITSCLKSAGKPSKDRSDCGKQGEE
jgi:hypothetical protein